MKLYRDHGVVLRTIKLGESDQIITLITEGRGKVRAVAKGVRKTKSRFGGRLEPMTSRGASDVRGPRARHDHPGRDRRPLPFDP